MLGLNVSGRWLIDTAERAGWTGVQGAAAYLITVLASLPEWVAVPLMIALVALKGLAARRIGDPESAATLRTPPPDLGPALDRSGP